MYDSLDQAFTDRTKDISSIFSSYRTLYEIYLGALRKLNTNQNTIKAIENAKKSVDQRQRQISGQLYAQGFILLTGAGEALLKDLFICLLKENFNQVDAPNSVNFSAKEIQDVLNQALLDKTDFSNVSYGLGDLMVKKLTTSKNPIERINFQNIKATQQIFDKYFGIKLTDSDYLAHIHKHWQVRHALIHNNGVIDERFMHNVRIVGLLNKNEVLGSSVIITKLIYSDANEDFLRLFNELDQYIEGTNSSTYQKDLRLTLRNYPELRFR